MKYKNKLLRDKKGFELLGENTVQLIIAVLCIVILIILGMALYEFFMGNSGDIKKAEYELKEMKASLRSITDDKTERNYIVTTIQDWWLFSEEYGQLCGGSFCLCVCKEKDCSGKIKACIATDKFVLIRGEDGREVRIIQLTSPSELKMKLSNGIVYPFNADKPVSDYSTVAKTAAFLINPAAGIAALTADLNVVFSVTPLFFKFDNEWKWSPDLTNWMDTKTMKVTAGEWKDKEPVEANTELIKFVSNLKDTSGSKGIAIFEQTKIHKSDGVYVIQK